MSDCHDDEDIITVEDAVYEMDAQVEESIAILGASDSDNCTYSMGYMERQALFACKTCDLKSDAGICYACSLTCHHEHDLIELYTKRNIRCDCGNSKFNGFECSLIKNKDLLNEKNAYNHNYKGLYCICDRPYPDPEVEIEDEMIQCVACEDWYHSRHLGSLPPAEFHEMVCYLCVAKYNFLQYYYNDQVNTPDIDVVSVDKEKESKITDSHFSPSDILTNEEKQNKIKKNEEMCRLEKLKHQFGNLSNLYKNVSFYWNDGWRSSLCNCAMCLDLYEKNSIPFIIKESDTITFYENKGKEKADNLLKDAANTISSMPIVQQVELARGYQELKSGLQNFLRSFPPNQIVKKEDVESFFEELNERKRRRVTNIPPNTCR
ncbi:putative E3 ubiquitin-protein ligase UBR7 isoform X3 [Hydra vulgaris]|uniref:E3 ubiquitin-protein ligase UBR7 isoform X3 n=1 Tax=Hydra vulgaris TaxID=6087 RepID=A0ABM4C6P9_HYDVU